MCCFSCVSVVFEVLYDVLCLLNFAVVLDDFGPLQLTLTWKDKESKKDRIKIPTVTVDMPPLWNVYMDVVHDMGILLPRPQSVLDDKNK